MSKERTPISLRKGIEISAKTRESSNTPKLPQAPLPSPSSTCISVHPRPTPGSSPIPAAA
jgi:hypothetical protein